MPVNTVDEMFSLVENRTNLERDPGTSMRPYRLDRMARLLEACGNPEREYPIVHIAGSKGKGSTGAFIGSVLSASGSVTGVYASPHVSSYRERIRLADHDVAEEIFLECHEELDRSVGSLVESLPGSEAPTTFELLTLLAFLVFRKLRCDWVVLETGIGGRLDATNVVRPAASVITPIELEHSELLGETVEKIAAEKAGIIKPGVPVLLASQVPTVTKVVSDTASMRRSPIRCYDEQILSVETRPVGQNTRATIARIDGERMTIDLRMNGQVQGENAALAWLVCEELLRSTIADTEERNRIIRLGLEQAFLPGRMEVLSLDPPLLLDAAHTPESIRRLVDSIRTYAEPRYLLFGSVSGKRHEEMAAILAPAFERIIVSTPGHFKPSNPEAVGRAFARWNEHVEVRKDPVSAVESLMGGERTAARIVTGSFYMVAEARSCLGGRQG